VRLRNPDPRRALTAEQRREMLRLIAAVPPDAGSEHPAVVELLEYHRSLHLPPEAPGLDYRIRLGNVAAGLSSLRKLADCEDWAAARRVAVTQFQAERWRRLIENDEHDRLADPKRRAAGRSAEARHGHGPRDRTVAPSQCRVSASSRQASIAALSSSAASGASARA